MYSNSEIQILHLPPIMKHIALYLVKILNTEYLRIINK